MMRTGVALDAVNCAGAALVKSDVAGAVADATNDAAGTDSAIPDPATNEGATEK